MIAMMPWMGLGMTLNSANRMLGRMRSVLNYSLGAIAPIGFNSIWPFALATMN
jgi:hypothetical protein